MNSLTAALSAALGGPVQRPALLVEAGFDTVRRWSSFATLTWNGNTWSTQAMRIEGLQVAALQVRGSLVLDNRDGAAGALVLAEGVQDRSIRIWAYDAAATATADVVWLADAVGAGATISETEVTIALRDAAEATLTPRQFVTAANGFGQLLPSGSVIRLNGQDYRLERR